MDVHVCERAYCQSWPASQFCRSHVQQLMTKIASMLILNALARVCRHAVVETSGTCTANTLQQEFCDDYFQSLLGAGGKLHVDITEGQHQKQFGKNFAQNFVDKELNFVCGCANPFQQCLAQPRPTLGADGLQLSDVS